MPTAVVRRSAQTIAMSLAVGRAPLGLVDVGTRGLGEADTGGEEGGLALGTSDDDVTRSLAAS